MHPDEIAVSDDLVRGLLRDQLPALAEAPLHRVSSSGTVSALYRVGEDALVRLPIMAEWGDADVEARTLAVIRPALSTRVPRVRLVGRPTPAYPCPWLVLDWIDGALPAPGSGDVALADDLVAFLRELWMLSPQRARRGYRVDLLRHDGAVRDSLAAASDLLDVDALTRLWDDALAAAPWAEPPRWTHSDLLPGNVLVDAGGRLAAVIDWEAAGIGDPACDLMAAWSILGAHGRERMRRRLGLDDAAWRRGRGWALAQAAIALPYYRDSNPGVVATSLHVLAELVGASA